MTKKLLAAALAIAACAALWGAVCPQNASGGKVPASDQVISTADAAQEEHTEAIPLSAAEEEYAPAEETNSPLPTEAPEPTTAAPQPAQNPQSKQPQPSAVPAPGERSVAGGKAQVWVPGFGWVEDGGGNVCTYAEDLYENGNKIGNMG